MLLVSNNVLNCGQLLLPDDTVIRINMAWISSVEDLKEQLAEIQHDVFLDNPVGRSKPPSNKYTLEELVEIMEEFPQIKYFAVSNVESRHDLFDAYHAVPDHVTVVPKIETIKGVQNIGDTLLLVGGERLIMLDHDDLFADIVRQGEDPADLYEKYVAYLERCVYGSKASILRTQGIIFSSNRM